MQCPNCQTINPLNAKFCMECGNRLVVCPNCGTVNLPTAKFCIECGTSLQPGAENTVPFSSPQEANNGTFDPGGPILLPSASVSTLLPPEERRVVTIMFADITGSTPLGDRTDPEELRAILAGYFNLMAAQIRRHGGTLEKYIGDAVMAAFGTPITHEDDPERAIRAALDMQEALANFNDERIAKDTNTTRLQMRIGINTGEVATSTNSQRRQDFLITGDAVNVAARLQQVATPDTILVGERTYLATREVFDFRAIAPLHLKGKPEPVSTFVVLGSRTSTAIITQHPRGIDGREPPLIGRRLELRMIHLSFDHVQSERRPYFITILGASGIGKSRLVHEFIDQIQEAVKSTSSLSNNPPPLMLHGRCLPYGEGITYWPLVEILRTLLHVREEDSLEVLRDRFKTFVVETMNNAHRSESAEEIASTISRSIGGRLSDSSLTSDGISRERAGRDMPRNTYTTSLKQSGTQMALLRAWRVLLEALAVQQSLIIVVDDLQWADEALLDLLEYLADRITTVPILFLCPARPDFFERRRDWGGGRRNFTTIELDALTAEESSELVDALLSTNELPEVLRQTILSRAEGNPFFVEEIIRMFIDQGVLVFDGNHTDGNACWRISQKEHLLLGELAAPGDHERPEDTLLNMHYVLPLPRVPDTIQGVLAARVDLLSPTEKLILQHAAVIGRTFWLSTLLELSSDLESELVLEALNSLIQRDFIAEEEKEIRTPVEHDSAFNFKHILIRDVVYGTIPRARRSQEHAWLAAWLEETTAHDLNRFTELLAYHYQQAVIMWSSGLSVTAIEVPNPADPEGPPLQLTRPELRRRAIAHLIIAGDQALNSYYTIRALQAYNDAFDLLTEGDATPLQLIEIHEKLGEAYSQRGNEDEAWQEYRQALRIATNADISIDKAQLLHLYTLLAELTTRWMGGFDSPVDLQEVRSYIDAGLEMLKDVPNSAEKVAFLTYEAFWYTRQLETATYVQKAELAEQAMASGHEALHMAEELDNPSALSLTLDALSFIYDQYHKYKEVYQFTQRRQKLEQSLTDREELYDLYYSLGVAHENIGDYPTALMWFGRAWNNAQTMESPNMLISSMVGRMHTWRQWNRWNEAIQVARDLLQLIEQYQQDEKRQFWALETLATISYRMGRQEEGDQYTRQCKRLIDQQIERSGGESRALLASKLHAIHLAHEDWTRAAADYRQKLQASEPLPSPEVLATYAELAIMTGEARDIQEFITERAITAAEESGAQKSMIIALRAQGRMYMEQQQWKLAEDDLRQALRRCEVLDLPWESGLTLFQLGMLYRRRASELNELKPIRRNTDLARSRYHFEQALGFFEALGAAPMAQRVRLILMQDTKAPI